MLLVTFPLGVLDLGDLKPERDSEEEKVLEWEQEFREEEELPLLAVYSVVPQGTTLLLGARTDTMPRGIDREYIVEFKVKE